MRKIYISHKYGGLQSNADTAADIVKSLVKQYPNYLFISPIHSIGYLYNDVSYEQGMQYCYELLSLCDEMWVCSEKSKGVMLEVEYCKEHSIIYKEIHNAI